MPGEHARRDGSERPGAGTLLSVTRWPADRRRRYGSKHLAGARREQGVRALLDALTGPPTDPAAIAAEDRNAFTAAFAEATRRRNTAAAQAIQEAMEQRPASPPRRHMSGGTDPTALNDDDLLRDLKKKLGLGNSYSLDN